jgi:oligopeptidase B
LNPWGIHLGEVDTYCVYELGCIPSKHQLKEEYICGKRYASVEARTTRSVDGTTVPYLIVRSTSSKDPNKLMTLVYGAYNHKTTVSMNRWKPYLDAGWTLVVAMVRGGGDYGDQWAEDARRDKKYKSIEDLEAIIRSAQRDTGIGWKSTALYGRSAGGYCVGAVCSRHTHGGLIGMAYAEVPYVDILRTTTNDSLPLTILEYDEFGNPKKRLEDFQTILRLSPVDSLGKEGAPGIFVVAITSANDREVLTYESMKWIQRLRGDEGKGELKVLRILNGKGHFVKGSDADIQRYEDFILLNSFANEKSRYYPK